MQGVAGTKVLGMMFVTTFVAFEIMALARQMESRTGDILWRLSHLRSMIQRDTRYAGGMWPLAHLLDQHDRNAIRRITILEQYVFVFALATHIGAFSWVISDISRIPGFWSAFGTLFHHFYSGVLLFGLIDILRLCGRK